eukprot:187694-Rhodomonas_salina.2
MILERLGSLGFIGGTETESFLSGDRENFKLTRSRVTAFADASATVNYGTRAAALHGTAITTTTSTSTGTTGRNSHPGRRQNLFKVRLGTGSYPDPTGCGSHAGGKFAE